MDLSVIIVSWNTRDFLRQCLSSLRQDSGELSAEVWVVDNASTDGSVEMVQSEYPGVNLIANQGNEGFARACNQALARSRGSYCFLLNSDTTVPDGVLTGIVQFMEANPLAGVVGCAQIYPDGQWQVTCHRDISLVGETCIALGLASICRGLLDYDVRRSDRSGPRQVDWVEGGSLLIRRAILAHVGLLDEGFFMYAEDADLCYRVRKAGFGIHYLPDIQIIHHRGQSSGFEQRKQRGQRVNTALLVTLHRSKAHYLRKHYGSAQARIYGLLVGVYSLRKLGMTLVAYILQKIDKEAWESISSAYLALMRAD